MFDRGKGVPQDDAEAVRWYRRAAEQGYARAQFNLGLMYRKGQGVLRDYVQAHKWISLAAAQGEESYRKSIDILAGRMTPTQIDLAQWLAREWKPKQ